MGGWLFVNKEFPTTVKRNGFMDGSECEECVFSRRFISGDAGDEVLIAFTKLINENVDGRGIVGRMGGDEIVIVTENIGDQTEL